MAGDAVEKFVGDQFTQEGWASFNTRGFQKYYIPGSVGSSIAFILHIGLDKDDLIREWQLALKFIKSVLYELDGLHDDILVVFRKLKDIALCKDYQFIERRSLIQVTPIDVHLRQTVIIRGVT
jgi:hypothetical protein